MIKIAICDIDRAELEKTSRLVEGFFENGKTDIDVITFKDTFELSEYMKNHDSFDLLILDATRRATNGIKFAAELRKIGENCEIIFVSNSTECAYDAYKLNAIQYLLKPCQKAELHSAIRRALIQIGNTSPGYTVLKTSGGVRRVGWDKIINSYTVGHYQLIYLTNGGELKLRATSDELYSMLEESGYFMRVGTPYIINIEHLRDIKTREIALDNGAIIPLPKNSYTRIKREFAEKREKLNLKYN